MKIVLITSGLNPLARQFHTLPGAPIGIIRLHSDDHEHRLKTLARRIYRELSRANYTTLTEYCDFHDLNYREINKKDVAGLQRCLADWNAALVVTSTCPIVSMKALEDIEFGAINVHPSKLPAYRGGNPIFWQLYDGANSLGTSVHKLTAQVDRGAVIAQSQTPHRSGLSKKDWARLLEGELGIHCLRKSIEATLITGHLPVGIPQPEDSPSRFAGNLGTSKVHSTLMSVRNLPSNFWDCTRYLGYCPGTVFGIQGHRAEWAWRPWSYKTSRKNATVRIDEPQIHVRLFSVTVHYPDRVLRFLPSGLYYMATFISKFSSKLRWLKNKLGATGMIATKE